MTELFAPYGVTGRLLAKGDDSVTEIPETLATQHQYRATTPPQRNPQARAIGASLRAWVRAVRPEQWLKNGFVLSPLVFSGKALIWDAEWRAALAFAAFCVVASAVYLMNDVVDRHADLQHPTKSNRPIAVGLITPTQALTAAVFFGAVGLGLGALSGGRVALILASYLGLNVLYGTWLKNVVIVDVFSIAAFFIMRLLAGAFAIDVTPSIWLLLCGGLLALYLGFAKRRHELVLLGKASSDHRVVLGSYSTTLLDQLSVVLLSVTIVAYIMYTLESETARLVGTEALSYSTVFVLFGVFRYLYLVHRNEGGNPTETLLTDRALMLAVGLWAVYCGGVIYFSG